MVRQVSYDEYGVDKTMSCDELQDAAMDNLAVEAMTLQTKINGLRSELSETTADRNRLQGQFNELTNELDKLSDESCQVQRDLFFLYNMVNQVLNYEPEEKTLCSAIRMLISRYGENSAHLENVRNINAMLVGQVSRLTYAFNPEGEELDPVDPNKNLEVVVSEVIDKAIRAFTEAQIGYELTGQVTALNRENNALMSATKDHQEYQSSIRKAIVDSGLLKGVRDLDSMHLDETVEELIKAARGRAALEVDANNLRELNTTLAKSLIAVDSMLRDAGIHGPRVEEEHLGENSQLIAIDVAEAISQMKDLSSHLKSLKALKIEPVSMVSEAWGALRRAGVRTEDHATLADAIIHLDQWNNDEIKGDLKRRCEVIDAAWRALNTIEGMKIGEHMSLADAIRWLGHQAEIARVRSETHTEFVNGVLTVHTEGATVIIVDHNA